MAIIEMDGKPCGKIMQKHDVLLFDLAIDQIITRATNKKTYHSVPHYPPIIEDLTFVFQEKTYIGHVIKEVRNAYAIIANVFLLDSYKNSFTFRLYYQHQTRSLKDSEVKEIRENIIQSIQTKFKAKIKS